MQKTAPVKCPRRCWSPDQQLKYLLVLMLVCILGQVPGITQKQYAWKGTLTLRPEHTEKFGEGVAIYYAKTLSIMLRNGKSGSWFLSYHLVERTGLVVDDKATVKGNNLAKNDNAFLFKDKVFDSLVTLEGKLLPDSSAIQSQVQFNGVNYGALTLSKINNWGGDTTINNKKLEVAVFDDGDWRDMEVMAKFDDQPLKTTLGDYAGETIYIGIDSTDGFNFFNEYGLLVPENSDERYFQLIEADGKAHQFALHKFRLSDFDTETKSGETITVNQIYLGLLFFLVLLIAFYYFLYKKRNKDYVSPDAIQTVADQDWMQKILPIVRTGVNRSFWGTGTVWVIRNDGIFVYKKAKRKYIDALNDQQVTADTKAGEAVKINWDEIKLIETEKESALGKVRIHLHHTKGIEKLTLPGYELPNVLKAFHLLAGDKLKTDIPIRLHQYGIWIRICLFILCSFVLLAAPGIFENTVIGSFAPYIAYLLLVIGIITITFTPGWLEDQLARNKEKEARRLQKDQSHHQPFRSFWLSLVFRIAGGFILFYCIFLHLNNTWLLHRLDSFFSEAVQEQIVPISVIGYFAAALLLSLALAFANRDPRKITDVNTEPILYLRSFADDRETTFQPGTKLSSWMGVDPPYYQMNRYRFVPDSRWVKLRKKILKYFYNNHPVRLIRILAGLPVDTSEQQLELFFRKKGPFVAIGRPGEKIITTGANRMYVSNEEWQGVILDYLNRSQLIVLQPNSTEGVWWEIGKSVELVNPEKLFFCMINFRNRQNDYEDFRIRFEALKEGIQLPAFLGNSDGIYFLRFNANWQAQWVKLKYRKWYQWPFVGNAADLAKTLEI